MEPLVTRLYTCVCRIKEGGVFYGFRLIFECWLALYYRYLWFSGFQELVARVETSLEGAPGPQRQRKRMYSPRNRLRRDMVGDTPIYQLFVSGSSTGSDKLVLLQNLSSGCVDGVAWGIRGHPPFLREASLAIGHDISRATRPPCLQRSNGPYGVKQGPSCRFHESSEQRAG